MSDDPLAAFRKKGTTSPDIAEASDGPGAGGREPYKAFATKDKLRTLDIRTKDEGLSHAHAYTYLTNISYNRKTYGEVLLTMSRLLVTIKGRRLKPIVDALKLHTCEFIQEFDPQEFVDPADPDVAFVESIDVKLYGPSGTVIPTGATPAK